MACELKAGGELFVLQHSHTRHDRQQKRLLAGGAGWSEELADRDDTFACVIVYNGEPVKTRDKHDWLASGRASGHKNPAPKISSVS